ncbi:hypothetical protein CJ030_MR1G023822 [Morella rubra]|uniref:Uncharacterized protein n=1 Tax=Morella rubra TaxID=262757 RepID=A0A6A1WQ83_9ROSI|nr:hypothetical protein CJ030_MR1G023822 [Morella rubra]
MARGKRARHSLADADQTMTVEERRQLILGRLVQMERELGRWSSRGSTSRDSYDVTVRDITITFSAQWIAEFLGLPRPEGPQFLSWKT